jgi:hypothetical protein
MNMAISNIKSLNNLSKGDTGEIIQISGKPDTHRYLCSKGLAIGHIVSVDDTRSDAYFTIQSGNMVSTINKELAHNIKVRIS